MKDAIVRARVQSSLKRDLQQMTTEQERSLSDLVRIALRAYVAVHKSDEAQERYDRLVRDFVLPPKRGNLQDALSARELPYAMIECPKCGYTQWMMHVNDNASVSMHQDASRREIVVEVWVYCGNCNAQGWRKTMLFSEFEFIGEN